MRGLGKRRSLEIMAGLAKPTHGHRQVVGSKTLEEPGSAQRQAGRPGVFSFRRRAFLCPNYFRRTAPGGTPEIGADQIPTGAAFSGVRVHLSLETSPHSLSGGQQRRLVPCACEPPSREDPTVAAG